MTREDAIGYECRRKARKRAKARFTRDIFEWVARTDSAMCINNVMKFLLFVSRARDHGFGLLLNMLDIFAATSIFCFGAAGRSSASGFELAGAPTAVNNPKRGFGTSFRLNP